MDRYNINLLDNGNLNYYGNLIKKEDIEEDCEYSNSPIHPIKQDVWEQTCAQLSLQ